MADDELPLPGDAGRAGPGQPEGSARFGLTADEGRSGEASDDARSGETSDDAPGGLTPDGARPGLTPGAAPAEDAEVGDHLEMIPPDELRPFHWREHKAATVLIAALLAFFLPGLAALAVSDSSRPSNRHVSTTDAVTGDGPLDAGKITAQARIVGLDDPQTFVVSLENTGDEPVVLLDAKVVDVDPGMFVVGITGIPVPDPSSTTSTTSSTVATKTRAPATTTGIEIGPSVPGYVIPPWGDAPDNQVRGLQVSLAIDRTGRFGASGLEVTYTSAGVVYTQTVWNGWGLCTDIPLHDCYPRTLHALGVAASDATSTTTSSTLVQPN